MRVSFLLLLGALWMGCSEPAPAPTTGSNSNWLRACSADSDCGTSGSCECGACTVTCSADSECSGLSNAACSVATSPSTWAQCQSRDPAAGVCLPQCDFGACGDGQACVAGRCVLAALPDNETCAQLVTRETAERALEDDLLARVQATRSAGGVVCPGGAAAPVVPELRLDARLVCAARALATDLEVTRNTGLVDSLGRSTTDRLALVGYDQSSWGEVLAFSNGGAGEALADMLADDTRCPRLVDAGYLDVGVGSSGDAQVITLGSE